MFLCSPLFGEDEPILTNILIRWVETTNQNRFGTMKVSEMPLGNTKLEKKKDPLFVTSSPCWVDGDPQVHSPKDMSSLVILVVRIFHILTARDPT